MKAMARSLFAFQKTPARSILKSEGCCSEKKKTVLFQNTERDSDIENDNVFVDTVPGKLIIMMIYIHSPHKY